jgi:hypothetical protein
VISSLAGLESVFFLCLVVVSRSSSAFCLSQALSGSDFPRNLYFRKLSQKVFSSVVMLYSDDDISLLVPFLDIPVSLGNLLQRIASIYGRSYLSSLDKLFEEDQILRLFTCWRVITTGRAGGLNM